MKLRFSLIVPLLFAVGTTSAEDIYYRFEGVIVHTDDKDVGCSIEVGSRWHHCVALHKNSEDMAPEDQSIGLYQIDSGESLVGECSFDEQDTSYANEVVVTDGIWGDGFMVFNQLKSDEHPDIVFMNMFSWLNDTSANMFSSDALPILPTAFDAADERWIEISALDSYGAFYGHDGTLDVYSISAIPCGDVEDVLAYLISEVIALDLNTGISNSLDTKLQAVFDALTELDGRNVHYAINRMQAFIHEVQAQRGKHISLEDANHLLELAEAVLQMIA